MRQLPKITSAFLNLTNACNLACRYCFVEQNPKRMTLDTAIDAADWLAKNAGNSDTPAINYFGGEPLLMFDAIIRPLTEYIRQRYGLHYMLSITSNCTLMDEKIVAFLSANKVGLLLSMDGDKPSQDWNRPMRNGGSSFDVLDLKLPMLIEHFPDLTFRSTVTPRTANELYRNALYAEKKGFRYWFTMPNYFETWTEQDIAVLHEQMRLYQEHYIDRMRDGKRPILFTHMEQFFHRIVQRNQTIQNDVRRPNSICSSCVKCGLGASRFAGININGDVLACQEMFSHELDDLFLIGNIHTGIDDARREQLCSMWDSKHGYSSSCEKCPLDRICDGGCVANNYLASGDIHRSPEIACEWNRILFATAVNIMQTLGSEQNEKFKERWDLYVR